MISKGGMFFHNRGLFLSLLWLTAAVVTFKDVLTGYPFGLTFSVRYVDDLVVLFLYLWMFLDLGRRFNVRPIIAVWLWFFLLFLAFHFLQGLILSDSLLVLKYILFIRDNFWYFPVFYFSLRYLSCDSIYRLILFFVVVQLLFVVLGLVVYAGSAGGLLWEDDVNGSLGANSAHILSYALILVMPVMIHRRKYWFVFLMLSVVVLASARSAIFLLLLSLALFYASTRFSFRRVFGVAFVFILIIVPVYGQLNKYFTATLDPEILFSQQNADLKEGAGAARLSFFLYSISKVDDVEKALVGHGAASYSSRSAVVLQGDGYRALNELFSFDNEFVSGGSSYNAWIVEYGFLVFSMILVAFCLPVFNLRWNWYAAACFLTIFLGLSVQKLMESYAVSLYFWLVWSYFYRGKNPIFQSDPIC